MSGSINKVILIGNLGKDPEVRISQDGNQVVNLSLATTEKWKDKGTGEQKVKTEWHKVVVFNQGLIKIIQLYAKKGSKVYLEGTLQTRKWTDQTGAERYATEVVLSQFNGNFTLLDSYSAKEEPEIIATPAKQSTAKLTNPEDYEGLDDEAPF
jgi:single-strand DNA-binding protein